MLKLGTADFANQSLLMVNSSLLGDNVGALSATGGTLTVTAGAKLYIENAEAGKPIQLSAASIMVVM